MLTLFYLFLTIAIIGDHVAFGYLAPLAARLPLPGTPAVPGSPWPKPENLTENEIFATIASRDLLWSSNVECSILSRAFLRYDANFLFRDLEVTPSTNTPLLFRVVVNIPESVEENLCNEFPKLNTEDPNYERYSIDISMTSVNEASATITAHTVWGALHGVETFSQLIWKDDTRSHFYVNLTHITDAPRFPHRGLMLDTARHYVDLPILQSALDGMAYNKLNVFHWHAVDDQSFPFVSRRYPELAEKGAYLPQLTYEPEEVQQIIEYARDRGIRVLLEFDTPGHTLGFGKAFHQILTPCYADGETPGTGSPGNHAAYEILDPTNNYTFEVMREFFTEIATTVVKDEYVHLGMDEVYPDCWNSSPEIAKFMANHSMTNIHELEEYYATKLFEIIKSLGLKSIVWNDPIENNVTIPTDVIIQVWEGGNSNGTPSDGWIPHFQRALDAGHNTILSSCWYLNYVSYAGASSAEFRKYYECDPIVKLPNLTDEQKRLILGGEAANWGEYVDSTNLLPRIFPLVGATAERLWSPQFDISNDTTDDAWHRLDQHRCRMLWRGIPAQPIFNGYCFAQEKTGFRKSPTDDNNGAVVGSNSGIVVYIIALMALLLHALSK